MADSILNSTKKILGLEASYTPFDLDIMTYINSVFSTIEQLGVGPIGGFAIVDSDTTWDEYLVPSNQLNMVRTYVFLKVRMLFDPPTTSYLITAMENQIREAEWRLNLARELLIIPEVEDA